MTPMNTRKRKSDEASSFPDPNPMMKKRRMALTVAQKQALIDNLQLESTRATCTNQLGQMLIMDSHGTRQKTKSAV